jgi:DNA polymerase I
MIAMVDSTSEPASQVGATIALPHKVGLDEETRARLRARFHHFREMWVVDTEFVAPDGEKPDVVCLVAREVFSGREIRLWRDELRKMGAAPWDVGPEVVTVAYFLPAELGCFQALGWEHPAVTIDLFCEFRTETNGLYLPDGNGLLGALTYHGLDGMPAEEKKRMQLFVMSGGPWSEQERLDIVNYCAADVYATEQLLAAMADKIAADPRRLGHAVIRGRYMGAVATMEASGIPVDVPTFQLLRAGWGDILDSLITSVDADYDVYDGRTFKELEFRRYLVDNGIPWLRHPSGQLALDDGTFRKMAKAYPQVSALRELRHALGAMRQISISVGVDGRNRVRLSPFASRTGRNQPSNSKFLFGSATWLRGLIKPAEGNAIAYLDFSSQEIGIAAALSGDSKLWAAYASGDPYMAFAIDAGLAPIGATRATHKAHRNRCKAIVLGVQYGMGAESMAMGAGMSVIEAKQLLLLHRETYRTFWAWAEENVNRALLGGELTTPFGWRYRLRSYELPNPRSVQNWPMQSCGSDMLRLACIEIVKRGVILCAPVHDAVLIEAPVDKIDEHVELARSAMMWASSMVLGGPSCRVDAEIYRFPDRYMDEERGSVMWNNVMRLIEGPVWTPSGGEQE